MHTHKYHDGLYNLQSLLALSYISENEPLNWEQHVLILCKDPIVSLVTIVVLVENVDMNPGAKYY